MQPKEHFITQKRQVEIWPDPPLKPVDNNRRINENPFGWSPPRLNTGGKLQGGREPLLCYTKSCQLPTKPMGTASRGRSTRRRGGDGVWERGDGSVFRRSLTIRG
ncbi:hypothetical protein GWI33_014046 [Rhynchophorus ferrugineus]|uniref:Uncharacterized protein n=1 Tax=Rhynchophorus ferrugineus TaxID=354439 RepID=A0A834I5V4_RHYFE|nr:hypothetical protein GWI33_014046 [Rhynchophorus ferrugineus]